MAQQDTECVLASVFPEAKLVQRSPDFAASRGQRLREHPGPKTEPVFSYLRAAMLSRVSACSEPTRVTATNRQQRLTKRSVHGLRDEYYDLYSYYILHDLYDDLHLDGF